MLSQRKMLDSFGDQNLFIFPTEIHAVEKIEIINGIVTHPDNFGYYDCVAFKTNS